MASIVLGALLERGNTPIAAPTLVRAFDYTSKEAQDAAAASDPPITPTRLIRSDSHALLKALLSAPICYRNRGAPAGTLKALAPWCAEGRTDLRLHFAKTGTSVTNDPDATVDTWTAGGLQFANGAAYSYVVMVGTGSAQDTWARKMHAAQATVPLVSLLLGDLKGHAKSHPMANLLPAPPPIADASRTSISSPAPTLRAKIDTSWRQEIATQR